MTDEALELAHAIGLQPDYTDAWGHPRRTEPGTLAAMFRALGLPDDPAEALVGYRRHAVERLIPPAVVRRRGHPVEIPLTIPAGSDSETLSLSLRLEDGTEQAVSIPVGALAVADRFETGGDRYECRTAVPDWDPPLGYHRLRAEIGSRRTEALLIAAPNRAWNPWRGTDERLWGIAVQLYSVRSSRNWGIGDFTDLRELMSRAAAEGASAIGINPLHALFPDEPERVSPYSPSTRLYCNPLYLDIEAIPEFARSPEAQALVGSYEFQRELGRLRATPTIAYAEIAALKLRVLRLLFASFERSAGVQRRRAFDRYREQQGQTLERFAIYERLRDLRGTQDWSQRDWRNWPAELQDPDSPAIAAFAQQERAALRFTAYLQWQIDEQLAACARHAEQLGMAIGIYGDLAVGVDAGGAEAWWNQKVIVRGLSIGAPPDVMNRQGQNWGLPLFNPVELADEAFGPFIAVLRANMKHAGALRIDHILGLMRLWCIPDGQAAADGAYLTYPIRDLIAIIALESHRQRCLVIGEDLGTLPPGLGEALGAAGILSYRVLYFETEESRFRPPSAYKQDALITVGTHDLAPLTRWWHGDDITLRESLGLFQPQEVPPQREERARERNALAQWAGLDHAPTAPPYAAIHRTLARAPSRLMMVQFEDLLPEAQQVNLPGTSDEHQNWRHKLGADIPALFADRIVLDTLASVAAERPVYRPAPAQEKRPAKPTFASPPRATYRFQFNADFTFADAERLVPYLAALGVSHVYASSFFRARPGSSHGYDVTDHGMLNPEIGTEEQFGRLKEALHAAGIGLILDFVPNHMGIGRADNDWWLDVLEWGIASPYAKYFDIDWRSSRRLMRGKVLLPFLGDQYGTVLAAGELALRFDMASGSFSVWYADHRFPIRPQDYPELLRASGHPAAINLAEGFADLPSGTFRRNRDAARQRAAALKQGIGNLVAADADALARIEESVGRINADGQTHGALSLLHRLLERQHYRLAFWRVASDEINYRRFFDINELAGIRVEDPEVFNAIHRGVARLIAEGAIQGLRLDHIDGLADPAAYLRRLVALSRRYRPGSGRSRRPRDFYIIVEKILANPELLRDWPIAGTTGYEFANLTTWLFIDPAAKTMLDAAYAAEGGEESFETVAYNSKMQVMETMLGSELELLGERLERIAKADLSTRDFTRVRLRRAIAEIVAGMDVYRTYISDEGIATEDRRRISAAAARARRRWRGTDRSILDFVERVLTGDLLSPGDPRAGDADALVRRFQQYTGPVMAKSLEDTAFYRYNRLIALNEVGGEPSQFGISLRRFHEANVERALRWPDCMLASSTHDTKRGEDARLRIAALSEMAAEWSQAVAAWNEADTGTDGPRPESNDVYLIYQTLIGSWPAELTGMEAGKVDPGLLGAFRERVTSYVLKAVREAKLNTSWTDTNEPYETAVAALVGRLLDPQHPFLAAFLPFQARAARLGAANSLSQLVLKLTVPGMPDFYQGAELWNLSMADPDNRRPVDYAARQAMLGQDAERGAVDWSDQAWRSGAVKLSVSRRILDFRKRNPELFSRGLYRPIEVQGAEPERLVAFLRRHGGTTLLVLAGRLMGPLVQPGAGFAPHLAWKDLALPVPAAGGTWRDVLTGRTERLGDIVPAGDLLEDRPIGVWVSENG